MSRPLGRPFLTAQWLDLLMLNYEVEPALLMPHVPRGTTLDFWEGRALVSLVGFRFVDTRVLGIPVPWHRTFEEVNLRFYVQRQEGEETRRGVVFIRELVPRRAIAWVARTLYNEAYRGLPMRHTVGAPPASRTVSYEWRERGTWVGFGARTDGAPNSVMVGSEAEFITEHYWGYTRQRDGSTVEYRVDHPRWRVWDATDAHILGDLSTTYGSEFAALLHGAPRTAFVAQGSDIIVYPPRHLADSSTQSVHA
ncbi:MAG: DUF2071 domain-containing protein [Gemmatimonadaceae bacterium]|nr:DUF2071 domain-containing protein [Gemmatimonadaceae bacterium]